MNPAIWQKMAQGKNIKRSQIEIKKTHQKAIKTDNVITVIGKPVTSKYRKP